MTKLTKWYGRKRKLRVFVPSPTVELGVEGRWVYSWLALVGRPVSKRKLSRYTQVDRTRTLPKVLNKLAELGLVRWEGRKVGAAQPSGQFKEWAPGAKDWRMGLNYDLVPMPNEHCPLTVRQLLVYGLACKRRIKVNSFARLLEVDRATVRAAIQKLKKCGLVSENNEVIEPPGEGLTWFVDKRKIVPLAPFPELFPNWIRQLDDYALHHGPWKNYFVKLEEDCRALGYDLSKVVDLLKYSVGVLQKLGPFSALLLKLPAYLKRAEESTRKNREKGKWNGTSFGLFRHFVRQHVDGA